MNAIVSKFMKYVNYLMRDELDIKHKHANLILFAAVIAQIPAIIGSIILDTNMWGVVSELLVLGVLISFIWIVNHYKTSQIPLIIVCFLINNIALPVIYFSCGGRGTGTIIWMVLGAVFCFLLIDGIWAIICYVFCVATFVFCLLMQYFNKISVAYLETESAEIGDNCFAFAIIVFVIGATFKFQSHMYEAEHKKLEEREKELEETNKRLEKASRAKSDFLANMSHEIRTPINAVLGMDEMILRDCDNNDVLSYANDIDSAGRQLLSLVNDILDFSKIESGKFEIHEEDYEVSSLILDCYNLLSPRAKEKNLEFIVKNNPEIPRKLKGDFVRVKQIVTNLLTNAVKYTKKGSVKVEYDYRGFGGNKIFLEVSVSDTGIGISEEGRKKLFGTFSRIDEKEHRNIEGTGLGLAITKQLVEMMGGEIIVESTKGVGSVFKISVVQEILSEKPVGEISVETSQKVSNKKYTASFEAPEAKILVVDDVKMNLSVVKLLIRDTKISVETAESGADALVLLEKNHYDCVFLDHMMPHMDGIETLRRLKNECKINKDTPVIALTANAIAGADKVYEEAGFDGYLDKPVKGERMEKILLKFLPPEYIQFADKSVRE